MHAKSLRNWAFQRLLSTNIRAFCLHMVSPPTLEIFAQILTDLGMALADVVQEAQEPVNLSYTNSTIDDIESRLGRIRLSVLQALTGQGIDEKDVIFQDYLNMRYQGTETAMMILRPATGDFKQAFLEQHLREFNFIFPEARPILVDDVRIRGVGGTGSVDSDADLLASELKTATFASAPATISEREV
jgi:5-oxoprolinase (ATP-hydrolysing)